MTLDTPLRGTFGRRPPPRRKRGLGVRGAAPARGGRRDGRPRGRRGGQRADHRVDGGARRRASDGGDMLKVLAMAVAMANARLQEKIIANPAVEGMGTTLTALLWSDGHAAVCHIGDSRALPAARRRALPDHPRPHAGPVAGRRGPDQRRRRRHPPAAVAAAAGPGRPVGRRARPVGAREPARRPLPALLGRPVRGGQRRDAAGYAVDLVRDPDQAAPQLIELAIHGGGPDNITCIVADVVDTATTRCR